MNGELKRFLAEGTKSLFLLLILLLLLLAFPVFVFFSAGEATSVQQAARLQLENTSLLFGPAYSNPASLFKLVMTKYQKPDIVLIGTSRAMAFRSTFFNERFYNAGGAINRVNQAFFFLRNLSFSPKYYIVILDQNLFNDHFVKADPLEHLFLARPPSPLVTLRNNLAKIYGDYLVGKFSLSDLHSPGIGLRAKATKSGFRADGSNDPHQGYAFYNESQQDYQFRYTLQTIRNGASIFRYGDVVSKRALMSLDQLLSYAERENITVVGIFPLYPPSIWNLIKGDARFAYLDGLNETVNEIFQRHGMFFFDFSNASLFNVTDAEMQDGLHASERANAKALLSVIDRAPFKNILNKSALEESSGVTEQVLVDEGVSREHPNNT